MKINYIFTSKTGLKRSGNEDYADVFEVEDGLLAVVCDGLGGNNAGEIASKLAVSTIRDYFIQNNDEDYLSRMNNAVKTSNIRIKESALRTPEHQGMATTAVALYLNKNYAFWGHVGDSRIYFFYQNKLTQVSKDHSYVQRLLDDGYISPEQAETHPHRNVIMRALGDKPDIEVDHDYFTVQRNEPWKFFLCTDGVSGVLNNDEIEQLLIPSDLEFITNKFTKAIEERGAPDNFSFVIISNQVQAGR